MELNVFNGTALIVAGFGAGLIWTHFPQASAATDPTTIDLSAKHFLVSIDEVRQNFVFGDQFAGHYTKTVTLSDGSTRNIELTPMVHDGKQVVEFKDCGHRSYMGLNGTTTNGSLMVQLIEMDSARAQLKAEGWQ